MATVKRQKSGHWKAIIRRPALGVPVQVKTFRLEDDARAWARKTESELERGVWRDSAEADRTLLRDALKRYARECTVRKKGREPEESVLRTLSQERIAGLALSRIGSADIARTIVGWERASLAPATIKRRLAVVSAAFTHARKAWGMNALENPVRNTELPTLHNERTRRVSDDEINAVRAVTQSAELGSLIVLATETAMRRSELVGLRWKDIDPVKRVAHLGDTKNGYARDVPLSTRAIETLKAKPRRLDGRVFGLRPDAVTLAFRRAVARARRRYEDDCKEAGSEPDSGYLTDLRVHDLRHEATSRLAEIFGPHELAKITGHRDMRMLLRYYHPRAEDLAKRLA
ncbi:MAG TPA: site-specific integrase [Rhodanobacteraceae bacterium]|nr:site-specific integrase [Rhodanobacteraceae bacterium]